MRSSCVGEAAGGEGTNTEGAMAGALMAGAGISGFDSTTGVRVLLNGDFMAGRLSLSGD